MLPSAAPVHDVSSTQPEAGTALCLSGGGYRAMLFHVGCVWLLNDLGKLGSLKRISSVSGGSITAGVLGMNWSSLGLSPAMPGVARERFVEYFVTPVRAVASATIDEGAVFGGILLPGTISDHVAHKYDDLAFHGKTLQDLPDDTQGPRFVINATNVQSGVLVRFSKPYLWDYRVGRVVNPALPLAHAVAASSAFPPILSPCEIDLAKFGLHMEPADGTEDLHMPPYTTKLVLSDGGVYDNLGLETAWKRYDSLLVSDGGGHYQPEPAPHTDWARHAFRVLDLIDSQVRALRARQLITLFQQQERKGAYWSIRQQIATYGDPPVLACDPERTRELAATPTRLKEMDPTLQERLINWGYAISDAALRKYGNVGLPPPTFPYPAIGV